MTRTHTCDCHVCILVRVLPRDPVCDRAAERPRVLRCQVHQGQTQSKWVLSLRQLPIKRRAIHHTCRAARHSVPWHVGIQVLIGYTGQVIISSLSRPLLRFPRDAEASLNVCDWWDGKEGGLQRGYKACWQQHNNTVNREKNKNEEQHHEKCFVNVDRADLFPPRTFDDIVK